MKLVSFGDAIIQKLRRVTLDDSLLRNLGINEGDAVELFLDTEEEAIIIKKSRSTEIATVKDQPKAKMLKVRA